METPKSVHIAKAIENRGPAELDSSLIIIESRNLCELIASYSEPVVAV